MTPAETRDAVMRLIEFLADEHQREEPDAFGDATGIRAEAARAKYELAAVYRTLRVLAPLEVLQDRVDRLAADVPCSVHETVIAEIDEALRMRVTASILADAGIHGVYHALIEYALTHLFTVAASGIVLRGGLGEYSATGYTTTTESLIGSLPIVFPRLERRAGATSLELTIRLDELESEAAYAEKWYGLESITRVDTHDIAAGRLVAFARTKRVTRVRIVDVEMELDAELERRIVTAFWNPTVDDSTAREGAWSPPSRPSSWLWGDFEIGGMWVGIIRNQLAFVRNATSQFLPSAMPYPRRIPAA
jgi:hypothetical protein